MPTRSRAPRSRRDSGIVSRQRPAVTGPTLPVSPSGPAPDSVDRYLNELQGFQLLNARQELELAREIERLELEHWRALLSYRPALAVIADALELDPAPRKLDALRRLVTRRLAPGARAVERDSRCRSVATAAARELRELDVDRAAVRAADRAVRATLSSDPRAAAYLARVAAAQRAADDAKATFVNANLRLVITMARRCDRTLLSLGDLIQEGNFGLMRAVERFDYRRGYRFSTYASWWIRHSLNRALADKARLVRVPVHTLDAMGRLGRASAAIATRTGQTPTEAELAEFTGIPVEKVALLRSHEPIKQQLSLDRAFGEDQEQTLHDVVPDPEPADPERELDLATWQQELERLLEQLSPIEAAVLRYRFGLGDGEELTLQEVGRMYNLSRERIRQLQKQALDKLRSALQVRRPRSTDNDNDHSDAA